MRRRSPVSALSAVEYYADFKKELLASNCQKCSLSKHRTNIVVDRGNPEARVVFVGEAPGANEDREGRAFVGRGGKLLDELMLKEAGFDTNRDGLIINVAKCRPPANRPPTSEEAASCRPYLEKQLILVRPLILVLLGATALKHIIPEKKGSPMNEEVGKFFCHPAYPGMNIIVFFHPAYILRDPRKKPLMVEHIRRFKTLWTSLLGAH